MRILNLVCEAEVAELETIEDWAYAQDCEAGENDPFEFDSDDGNNSDDDSDDDDRGDDYHLPENWKKTWENDKYFAAPRIDVTR